MYWNHLAKIRWGEAIAFLTIFLVGAVVFAVQLATWAIPQLTLYQELVPTKGIILETRITEKKISTDEAEDIILFRPEVLLEYRVDSKIYRNWTFDYPTVSGNGGFIAERQAAEKALTPFTPERRLVCWYRATQPEKAIVVWDVSFWGWCLLILSLGLIILGFIGFWQSFRYLAVSKERQAVLSQPAKKSTEGWETVPDIHAVNESPGTRLSYRLPLGSRPMMSIIGLTIFAGAWNIVAAIVLIHLFFVSTETVTDMLVSTLLWVLFCTAGVILLWNVLRQLWTGIRISTTLLELSDHPVYPGRKYRVLLFQNGILHFRHLAVDLVCEEVARFHQGTDTAVSRKDVFRQTLFSQSDFSTSPEMPLDKEFYLQLPAGAVHSFRQENNEIIWKLELAVQLVHWKELRRDCPLIVRSNVLYSPD
ncbi:hypothetical protein FACS189419_00320 [Planctomycetales bacterium]|nr:hypothetical protein FACS189419_00320 [Planctomycetales bacterium]